MATDDPFPVSFYEEYWEDLPRFPLAVQDRLHTFLQLVGFDPDDRALLEVCDVRRVRLRRVYAYQLTEGYVVFWRVKRAKSKLKPAPPQVVEILAIERT